MPFLLTDADEGQQAMINMRLNPLKAQAMEERIPLETQKMQESLVTDKVNQQTAVLRLQALVESQADDKDVKQIIGDLVVKDSGFATLPIAEQQQRIGSALISKGKFTIGEKFYKDGQQSRMTDANIKKTEREIEQSNLERINTYLSGINTDGTSEEQVASLDTVLMGVKADGLMTPQQQQAFEKNARDALAANQLKQWKIEAQSTYDSIASKKQKEIEARNIAEDIRKREKDDEDREQRTASDNRRETRSRESEDARDARQEARIDARERRQERDLAFKEYNDITTRILPRLNDQIRKARRDAFEAPTNARKRADDEVATLEADRRDEYAKANNLRAQLKLPPLILPRDGPSPSRPNESTLGGGSQSKPKVVRPTPIRPSDVPNNWTVKEDASGQRAWVSPDSSEFKEIKNPNFGAGSSF